MCRRLKVKYAAPCSLYELQVLPVPGRLHCKKQSGRENETCGGWGGIGLSPSFYSAPVYPVPLPLTLYVLNVHCNCRAVFK